MSFDVAIGKCRSVANDTVEVWVDSSVVRRIVPGSTWRQAGISVLRVPLSLCSTRSATAPGDEVFLSSGLVGKRSTGLLDVDGTGEFVRIALAALVPTIDEQAAPPTPRKATWR